MNKLFFVIFILTMLTAFSSQEKPELVSSGIKTIKKEKKRTISNENNTPQLLISDRKKTDKISNEEPKPALMEKKAND